MNSAIWRIVGIVFVGMVGFGAVIPILPVYLHEQVGASAFLTGVLIGAANGFALPGRFVGGTLADNRGRRFTILIGMTFCVLAGILYLPGLGLWALSTGRVLHGFGDGLFVTATVAWVVDLAPPTRRAQAIGFLSSGMWGGLSIGPAVGQALGSMQRVALLLTLSSLAVMALVYAMREEAIPHHHEPARWFPRPVILPGILLGLGNVTYAAMSAFLILLLRQRGQSNPIAFSAFALAVLLGRGALAGIPDREGPRRSLFAGYTCLAVGLLAVALSANATVDLIASLLIGLGYSLPWPALASVVVGEVRPAERALALGALNAFYDVFVFVSSAVAGAAAGRWGRVAPFWLALTCIGAALALVFATGIGTTRKVVTMHPEERAA